MRQRRQNYGIAQDWPTLVLIVICYAGWAGVTVWLAAVSLWLAVPATALLIALQSSLQHEVIHGHPFRTQWINAAMVLPSLNLAIPYLRFRDTHLDHHKDAILTDPYDDPETNYVDPLVWDAMTGFVRRMLAFNNTLLGRLMVGPLVGQIFFVRRECDLIIGGDRAVALGWLVHLVTAALVLAWVTMVTAMPIWAYLLAAYLGLSLLKLRTFLEHQAHSSARGRTVVIEDRGIFALLFLNNNYHVVHHIHPRVSWFGLPALFRANRAKYLSVNHGYYYRSYASVIARHLFRPKDPVAHPIWRGDQRLVPLCAKPVRRWLSVRR